MCGIVGFVGMRNDHLLAEMRDALAHRGPDASGMFADPDVSLGHRRLAVLDLHTGDQPQYNSDDSHVIVFNGEIYNYRKLRDELAQEGYPFKTMSDTEVILAAYDRYGDACVEHLDGMFAFVIYDRTRKQLFGARDRLGKKPLFYISRENSTSGNAVHEIEFAFASEIKAFLRHPELANEMRLSHAGLISYLLNDYVLGGERIYEGVKSFDPGTAFTYGLSDSDSPGLKVWRYWDLSLHGPTSLIGIDEDEACERVIDLLREAVFKRLVADVPVGALLSGGIDSSSIVAFMVQAKPAHQVETFSIGFDDASYDESSYAEQVAAHFGTKHRNRQFTANELLERLPEMTASMDEPFADPSLLPVAMLCQFAREHVTVALGGDGGDELFAGYDPFRAVKPARWYRRLVPSFVHENVISPLSRCLPSSEQNMPLEFKVSRFLRGVVVPPELCSATWMGAFSPAQLRRLMPDAMSEAMVERAYSPIVVAYRQLADRGGDDLDQALDFFERFYMVDDILVKVDRASMRYALEVRTPFLDRELVEFVNALPNSMKLRKRTTKYLLKKALAGHDSRPPIIPQEIISRKKKGFGIPVARWIRHELKSTFCDVLIRDWPADKLPMFDCQELKRLYDEHMQRSHNHYKELWALFVLAQWANQHL
ncbi:MAG: asparagine synthase (glutamine-hydrolyzing) [Planctomycetaceae bacterium]